ncbi:hypothetical protein [Paenibacillus tyrfis]|uniref:hypothetical protein n=1 Tax=Paenibacillus tyrfis TaxID=1501230 RepID=UPI000B588B24|nr:hypothetical protein [Paenibacillus tyrfis]
MKPLEGHIAVVAGATRGAGRGIAEMLGEAGATVYVTGRSSRGRLSDMGRTETIEETARGGQAVICGYAELVEKVDFNKK